MIAHYYFTETEQKKILSSLRVLIDTREQANDHLISYFDQKRISWKAKKLDCGDYSFMIPALPDMGIMRDIYFTREAGGNRRRLIRISKESIVPTVPTVPEEENALLNLVL